MNSGGHSAVSAECHVSRLSKDVIFSFVATVGNWDEELGAWATFPELASVSIEKSITSKRHPGDDVHYDYRIVASLIESHEEVVNMTLKRDMCLSGNRGLFVIVRTAAGCNECRLTFDKFKDVKDFKRVLSRLQDDLSSDSGESGRMSNTTIGDDDVFDVPESPPPQETETEAVTEEEEERHSSIMLLNERSRLQPKAQPNNYVDSATLPETPSDTRRKMFSGTNIKHVTPVQMGLQGTYITHRTPAASAPSASSETPPQPPPPVPGMVKAYGVYKRLQSPAVCKSHQPADSTARASHHVTGSNHMMRGKAQLPQQQQHYSYTSRNQQHLSRQSIQPHFSDNDRSGQVHSNRSHHSTAPTTTTTGVPLFSRANKPRNKLLQPDRSPQPQHNHFSHPTNGRLPSVSNSSDGNTRLMPVESSYQENQPRTQHRYQVIDQRGPPPFDYYSTSKYEENSDYPRETNNNNNTTTTGARRDLMGNPKYRHDPSLDSNFQSLTYASRSKQHPTASAPHNSNRLHSSPSSIFRTSMAPKPKPDKNGLVKLPPSQVFSEPSLSSGRDSSTLTGDIQVCLEIDNSSLDRQQYVDERQRHRNNLSPSTGKSSRERSKNSSKLPGRSHATSPHQRTGGGTTDTERSSHRSQYVDDTTPVSVSMSIMSPPPSLSAPPHPPHATHRSMYSQRNNENDHYYVPAAGTHFLEALPPERYQPSSHPHEYPTEPGSLCPTATTRITLDTSVAVAPNQPTNGCTSTIQPQDPAVAATANLSNWRPSGPRYGDYRETKGSNGAVNISDDGIQQNGVQQQQQQAQQLQQQHQQPQYHKAKSHKYDHYSHPASSASKTPPACATTTGGLRRSGSSAIGGYGGGYKMNYEYKEQVRIPTRKRKCRHILCCSCATTDQDDLPTGTAAAAAAAGSASNGAMSKSDSWRRGGRKGSGRGGGGSTSASGGGGGATASRHGVPRPIEFSETCRNCTQRYSPSNNSSGACPQSQSPYDDSCLSFIRKVTCMDCAGVIVHSCCQSGISVSSSAHITDNSPPTSHSHPHDSFDSASDSGDPLSCTVCCSGRSPSTKRSSSASMRTSPMTHHIQSADSMTHHVPSLGDINHPYYNHESYEPDYWLDDDVPCICSSPSARCIGRWSLIGFLSCLLPCLLCYPLLRLCHVTGKQMHVCGPRHQPYKPSSPELSSTDFTSSTTLK